MPRSAVFTVTLSRPHTEQVSVAWGTVPGTATAPEDFTADNGTLIFDAGQTSKEIVVSIRDHIPGALAEQFTVALSNPVNAAVTDGSGLCIIPGDTGTPTLPSISVNNVTVS